MRRIGFCVAWRARPDLEGSIWEANFNGAVLTVKRGPPKNGDFLRWDSGAFVGRIGVRKVARGFTPMQVMEDMDALLRAAAKVAA